MGFNLSVLKEWHDVNNSLTIKAIEESKLKNLRLKQIPDVKGSVEVPFLYSSMSVSNVECNTTTSGTTNLGTTTVGTCFCSAHEEICASNLNNTTFSSKQTDLNSLVFEDAMAEEGALQLAKIVENIWLRATPTVPVEGALCSGFLYMLDSNTASTVNVTYSALTTNGVVRLDAYCALIPEAVRTKDFVFVAVKPSDFDAIKIAYREGKYFIPDQDANPDVFKVPGYDNIYVVKLPGLTGVNKAFISYGDNIIQAYNINSGLEMYKDMSKRKYVKHADFRLGAGAHFYDHIVYIK